MTARIRIEGLCKSFAAPVLKGVELEIMPGSIHGLVGENGAGKSTLINIISGLLAADSGTLELNGQIYSVPSRREALQKGIALAAQELSLIDTLTVAENIFLSALPQNSMTVDRARLGKHAEELMEQVGLNAMSAQTPLSNLTLADKQLVELAKALSMSPENCQLLILDEPTSALTAPQAEQIHQIIRERVANGLSIIYVSHRLDDVLSVCDDVSVLRDGIIVSTAPTTSQTVDDLITDMCGQDLLEHSECSLRQAGDLRLKVEQLSSAIFPQPVSFNCRRGEILGLAGLAGAGRSELLHTIFGLAPDRQGRVVLLNEGAEVEVRSPSEGVKMGMALIAEDRKTQGNFADKPVSLNTTIAGLGKLGAALAFLLPRREQRISEELIDRLQIKCEGPHQSIDRLSGGNQQKALIARWLQTESDVWLLDEPTRGVDVASKLAIHAKLRELRDLGACLLIVSSELEELTALSDRILVLSNRKAVATFERGQWSNEQLLVEMFSAHRGQRVVNH